MTKAKRDRKKLAHPASCSAVPEFIPAQPGGRHLQRPTSTSNGNFDWGGVRVALFVRHAQPIPFPYLM
jgi:hypothetical protein